MAFRFEGLAIVSADGMLADAAGVMPSELVIKADQKFLSDSLDRAAIIVHGRNSHENQPKSPRRPRLIATRRIDATAPVPGQLRALWWNPEAMLFESAARLLGITGGTAAVLGGTDIFALFLSRYDAFHLSRVYDVRLPHGRPVFPRLAQRTIEDALADSGLSLAGERVLDPVRGVRLFTWQRETHARTSLVSAAHGQR